MVRKELPFSLENMIRNNYITESDSEILKLINENEDLKILQSKDVYNWQKNDGKTEHILSMAKPQKITYFDDKLDIFVVDNEKLKETKNSYGIESRLYNPNFNKKDSIPNLKELNLSINYNDSIIDLGGYSLITSERYIEYPNLKENRENENKTITAVFYDNTLKKDIKIVYRQTFNNKVQVGSRLYISEKGDLKILDKEKNIDLSGFMFALDNWHDNRLKEKDTRIVKFGTGSNLPSYLSLYY